MDRYSFGMFDKIHENNIYDFKKIDHKDRTPKTPKNPKHLKVKKFQHMPCGLLLERYGIGEPFQIVLKHRTRPWSSRRPHLKILQIDILRPKRCIFSQNQKCVGCFIDSSRSSFLPFAPQRRARQRAARRCVHRLNL